MRATDRPLHRSDDVTPLTHRSQGLLGVGMNHPHARLRGTRESQAPQVLQAADQQLALSAQSGLDQALNTYQAIDRLVL